MIADGREQAEHFEMCPPPAWAETWHLWTVLMPRRSISGKRVFGQVWRRRSGGRWEYRKSVEISPSRDRINCIRQLNERQEITHRSPGHHAAQDRQAATDCGGLRAGHNGACGL